MLTSRTDKSLETSGFSTPRSQRSDEDDMSMKNGEKISEEEKAKMTYKVKKFFKKQAKAVVKAFVDYGPPYIDQPFDPILVNECAKPVFNFFEVHKILNTKVDPNIPDPEDLYYTPMHWVARNAHLMGMKMLRRAGAKINVTNEMGLSPLDLCVMMKHPPDKRNEQVNMALYLLENGADPNNRDKGGYSAIDHAAVNQDLEMINILIDFGANVMRENNILVAKRHHILKNVYDPMCYKVLYERLIQEEGQFEKERQRRQKIDKVKEDEKYSERLHADLNKRKQKRLERERLANEKKAADSTLAARMAKLQKEMEENLKTKVELKSAHGIWKKGDGDHWAFEEQGVVPVTSAGIYAANRHIMGQLHTLNSIDVYSNRWSALTDGRGKLEMNWSKAEPFRLPDIHNPKGEGAKMPKSKSKQSQLLDVNYRDANDKELEGMDLDNVLNF